MSNKKMLIVPFYVNHAGCPQMCIFCNQERITGSAGGMPEYEVIPATISEYLESWKGSGKREVAFYGGSFTAINKETQEKLLEMVYPFVKKGVIDSIRISTRSDYIDDEIITFLEDYGVRTIELGIQSMNDSVLAAAMRGHTVNDSIRASTLIKERGVLLGCQLMPGLPGESQEMTIKGACEVAALKPDFVRIYPTLVIKGTRMEALFREGAYSPMKLEEAVNLCGDMVEIFRSKDINIIRVGLQSTKELEDSVIAGPYHPSFGEMVESSIFLRKAKALISETGLSGDSISLALAPQDESAFRGIRNSNMEKLKKSFPDLNFEISAKYEMKRGSLMLNCNA